MHRFFLRLELRRGPAFADARAPARVREAGFGVVELTVTMIIVTILTATIISSFRGSKSATYKKETVAAASAYSQTIAQYQADHANLNPTPDKMAMVGGMPAGPRNLLNRAYMGSPPDGVTSGRISVSVTCGLNGSGTWGHIAYCPTNAGPGYDIQVFTRPNAGKPFTNPPCHLGSSAAAPRC